MAARGLLYRAAQQQHRVRGLEAGQRRKRELELTRTELGLEGAQRESQFRKAFLKDLNDGVDEIVALLGEVLVAGGEELHFRRRPRLPGVGRLQVRVDDLEDVKLHFEAGDELISE